MRARYQLEQVPSVWVLKTTKTKMPQAQLISLERAPWALNQEVLEEDQEEVVLLLVVEVQVAAEKDLDLQQQHQQ